MEEKKKIKVKFGTVASIIIIIVLLFALFGMWYYYNYVKVVDRINANVEVANIEENKTHLDYTKENIEKYLGNNIESTNSDTKEKEQIKLEKSDRFTIEKVEENADNYKIYVHILSNDEKKVTKEEYQNLIDGGTIKFRGHEWKYSQEKEIEGTILKEDNTQNEMLALIADDNKDYYYVHNLVGDGDYLNDYKTDEITIFNVSKDIKVGDTFETFEYDSTSKTIKVKDFEGKNVEQSESITSNFLKEFNESYTVGHYGECVAYLLNGKIVAIQTFKSTGP